MRFTWILVQFRKNYLIRIKDLEDAYDSHVGKLNYA